jgi:hypothetical protein
MSHDDQRFNWVIRGEDLLRVTERTWTGELWPLHALSHTDGENVAMLFSEAAQHLPILS